ncbi:uncharacterized protein EI90DRAFT_3064582 [Cantharellus anzutake]|uniref:uncharacterized protein n=1 Tax=Cantharellus anzutake TaxID=1750568 RepID=UPI001902DB80|nr:uncharacterized protein EI90DRAFT_3064582 [Cantharellus anzutake]KAF8328558.1 hypothetical protein EI90DRAFT_3064582 [Cantharellus anzutake]
MNFMLRRSLVVLPAPSPLSATAMLSNTPPLLNPRPSTVMRIVSWCIRTFRPFSLSDEFGSAAPVAGAACS